MNKEKSVAKIDLFLEGQNSPQTFLLNRHIGSIKRHKQSGQPIPLDKLPAIM